MAKHVTQDLYTLWHTIVEAQHMIQCILPACVSIQLES
jgi:hypothetical protein